MAILIHPLAANDRERRRRSRCDPLFFQPSSHAHWTDASSTSMDVRACVHHTAARVSTASPRGLAPATRSFGSPPCSSLTGPTRITSVGQIAVNSSESQDAQSVYTIPILTRFVPWRPALTPLSPAVSLTSRTIHTLWATTSMVLLLRDPPARSSQETQTETVCDQHEPAKYWRLILHR